MLFRLPKLCQKFNFKLLFVCFGGLRMRSNTSIEGLFDSALQMKMSDLAFRDSEELIQRRLRILEKFCRAGLPESLVSKAKIVVELTKAADIACAGLAKLAK